MTMDAFESSMGSVVSYDRLLWIAKPRLITIPSASYFITTLPATPHIKILVHIDDYAITTFNAPEYTNLNEFSAVCSFDK